MDIPYFIICTNLLVFAIAPFLPNAFYDYFVDTYVGAGILLLLVLYSITYGYLVTVSSFISVGALYAESHVRKASKVKKVAPVVAMQHTNSSSIENQLGEAAKLMPDEVHPDSLTTEEEHVTFVPKSEEDADVFKSVGASIDEKEVMPTMSTKDVNSTFEGPTTSDKQD